MNVSAAPRSDGYCILGFKINLTTGLGSNVGMHDRCPKLLR